MKKLTSICLLCALCALSGIRPAPAAARDGEGEYVPPPGQQGGAQVWGTQDLEGGPDRRAHTSTRRDGNGDIVTSVVPPPPPAQPQQWNGPIYVTPWVSPDGSYTVGGQGSVYPGGAYPGGAYPGGAYPGGPLPGVPYPGGQYPGGQHSGNVSPGGQYPGGQYPGGNPGDGQYHGEIRSAHMAPHALAPWSRVMIDGKVGLTGTFQGVVWDIVGGSRASYASFQLSPQDKSDGSVRLTPVVANNIFPGEVVLWPTDFEMSGGERGQRFDELLHEVTARPSKHGKAEKIELQSDP